MIIKNTKPEELNTKIVSLFLNTQTSKDDLIEFKCFFCNKNYQKTKKIENES